jgi:hypothetical protein
MFEEPAGALNTLNHSDCPLLESGIGHLLLGMRATPPPLGQTMEKFQRVAKQHLALFRQGGVFIKGKVGFWMRNAGHSCALDLSTMPLPDLGFMVFAGASKATVAQSHEAMSQEECLPYPPLVTPPPLGGERHFDISSGNGWLCRYCASALCQS